MRGDRPRDTIIASIQWVFTPHARGSTAAAHSCDEVLRVYPACAGIDLLADRARGPVSGLPRMRGDRPYFEIKLVPWELFTPHARGSTSADIRVPLDTIVYPACAGIDRIFLAPPACSRSLPRMRGDRPLLDSIQ